MNSVLFAVVLITLDNKLLGLGLGLALALDRTE